jgi:hypothetical protein
MKNRAAALALLTFILGIGVGLYGQSRYTSLQLEIDRENDECKRAADGPYDALMKCAMGTTSAEWSAYEAEDTRNYGFAFAIGAPLAIWGLVLLSRAATSRAVRQGAIRGAQVGRIAVDELSKRSARATKDVVGAVAQISDSAQGRTRECPFCAEMIKPQAKVCRHCGKDVA